MRQFNSFIIGRAARFGLIFLPQLMETNAGFSPDVSLIVIWVNGANIIESVKKKRITAFSTSS